MRSARRHIILGVLAVLVVVTVLVWLFIATPPSRSAAAPSVAARSGILIERASGQILWSKNAGRRLPPASCAKIMTALLTLEHFRDLDRYVRAPAGVTRMQKVAVGLRPGDRITVRQALRGLLIESANDAALTLAVAVAGSERAFVRQMNRRALQLGLTDTRYLNSRGSDQAGQYMSARDLATLARHAMADARFRAIVRTQRAVIAWPPDHRVVVTSRNRLLWHPWADGIKTGATERAGKVLVGSGRPYGVALIIVTMQQPSRAREARDAAALLRWGAAESLRRRGGGGGVPSPAVASPSPAATSSSP